MAILKNSLTKIVGWYERNERPISSISLVAGFVFDALLLKRVDTPLENLFIVLHLVGAAVGIIVLNIFENDVVKGKISEVARARWHFWLIIIIQFMFGGLLSKYLIFYFRSATLAASWPFLLLLALAFAFNERMRHHYARLSFQISFLFISIYAFAIYMLPVLLHRIGNGVFIASGIISLLILAVFLIILRYIAHEHYRKSRKILVVSILGIFLGVNILYFTNLIPPIPISLKDAGAFHSVTRLSNGNYKLTGEEGTWKDFLHSSSVIHKTENRPVYVYSAIFSPTRLNTTIVHEWQYYNEEQKEWVTVSTIPLAIVGGRDGGFRTYSIKQNVFTGRWRVNVKTLEGKYIGRIKFSVVNQKELPIFLEEVR
jgi:hypothetical protein